MKFLENVNMAQRTGDLILEVNGLFTEIGYNYNSLFTHATDHFLNIYKSLKYYSIADFFYYLALRS